jgi:hypothetical protein
MSDEEDAQPADADLSGGSSRSAGLPRAADILARPSLATDPLNDLDPDHKRRYYEATIKKLEIEAKQADDDREMRKAIAEQVFEAIKWQVAIADAAFLVYGFWNGWGIPGSTISAWLGATVVQAIAVGVVITRSLFPSEKKSEGS